MQEIRSRLLQEHRDATLRMAGYLDNRFKGIETKLNHVARYHPHTHPSMSDCPPPNTWLAVDCRLGYGHIRA